MMRVNNESEYINNNIDNDIYKRTGPSTSESESAMKSCKEIDTEKISTIWRTASYDLIANKVISVTINTSVNTSANDLLSE